LTTQLTFPSPDKKHNAVLTYLGETQSHLSYYSLSIDKYPLAFADRIFGKACLWSPESRFLSVQEWKDTDSANSPRTYLLLIIDVLTKRECLIASVDGTKGSILPEGYIGDSLMYAVLYYGPFGTTRSFESRFQYLDGWQTIK
jgi:hypothetical protein